MQEQTNQSTEKSQLVEWKIYEDQHLKETQVRKFINGHMTTQIRNRWSWSKRGRQGCWQRAYASIHSKETAPEQHKI